MGSDGLREILPGSAAVNFRLRARTVVGQVFRFYQTRQEF
jgi:hypothetical protein